MRIAYIISAYQLPDQLIRLVLRLNTPSTFFLIHLDKKTDDRVFHQLVKGLGHLGNVIFLPRHTCYWGDFGHVKATIKGIHEILERNLPFDYAFLLTGQDYPIKSNNDIETFLEADWDRSFMDYFPLPSDNWSPDGGLNRIRSWHIRLGLRVFIFPGAKNTASSSSQGRRLDINFFLPRRKFPTGYHPYGGSPYWCLSRECVEHIYEFIQRERAFVRFFHTVEVPDEIFFQTILLNSHLGVKVNNQDLWYIDWKDPHAARPAVLGKDDYGKLVASPKLFARKFDMSVDPDILDMIDDHLSGTTVREDEKSSTFSLDPE